MWIFTEYKQKYFLKQLKIDKEQSNVSLLQKIEIKDMALVHNIYQRKGNGFIETIRDNEN